MTLEANDLLLFARVVEEGSFSKAAEKLGVPKSTLSRRISALEAQLGERLILRTTRKLTVTDLGQSVLQHAQHVQEEVDATLALTQHRQAEPNGRLKVSMPGDFANHQMGELLSDFISKYPSVNLELDLSPRRVDLIGENFDVAIRAGDLPDDASLAARGLVRFSIGLYASPAYLKLYGAPAEPEALMEHDCLRLTARNGEPSIWRMEKDGAVWEGIPPGRASANSPELLTRLAVRGKGIIMLADHFAGQHIHKGELVPLLEDWKLPEITVWAVFPGRRLMPARTRVFLDALQAEFSGPRCQKMLEEVNDCKTGRISIKSY
ncbi:LysR family transcriptional regulator [Undibacterium sp. YM2]|uniref:LysR family transcriptional regulator n=1 Tax=Undibacterium sp. YM2 TaxID=2058625 RepID=UPI001331D439|nr:LysR family transcriptional regulator [Undibacterium sp. YM2]BBB64533.1 LysR family transcriptional regulator [Undibacterium sp. YM2]